MAMTQQIYTDKEILADALTAEKTATEISNKHQGHFNALYAQL